MADASSDRFAHYSTEDLARLLFEIEKGDDERLAALVAEVRAELARRSSLQ